MGCRQVVRHLVLVQAFRGSNPCTPVNNMPANSYLLNICQRLRFTIIWVFSFRRYMANHHSILALDFDGVICDGMQEYFHSSWLVYRQIWSVPTATAPPELFPTFARLRPLIEHGWEMPLLVWALQQNTSENQIASNWTGLAQQILDDHQLSSKDVVQVLDAVRDRSIAQDLPAWLNLQSCYPGTIEKLLALPANIHPIIITTKDGRFTRQLLEDRGVQLPPEAIFGKEGKQSKADTLRQLMTSQPQQIWFVEDRLPTLQTISQQPDLNSVQLFLADWGYNTPAERSTAQQDDRVTLLSIDQFCQDPSSWT
jgi:phosphoglycolate phosphatase-like HAD superfamily hydrolase